MGVSGPFGLERKIRERGESATMWRETWVKRRKRERERETERDRERSRPPCLIEREREVNRDREKVVKREREREVKGLCEKIWRDPYILYQ